MNDVEKQSDDKKAREPLLPRANRSTMESINGKHIVALLVFGTTAYLVWDAIFTPPDQRIIRPESSAMFLTWVQANPYLGMGAFVLVFAVCVVFMIPVGTPLTLGCGYIYKGAYGWVIGVSVATTVAMIGSGLGAVSCFVLGRYLMRNTVRQWIRKYPMFDAIDGGKCGIPSQPTGTHLDGFGGFLLNSAITMSAFLKRHVLPCN